MQTAPSVIKTAVTVNCTVTEALVKNLQLYGACIPYHLPEIAFRAIVGWLGSSVVVEVSIST
jgi:hypothetical protein